jgi:colanic acid biosynthesis glycosyl transferase WcaI
MKILIMAQHYAPEEVSGAVLGTELASDLVKRGHKITFVTCAPNYPMGKIFPGYKNQIYSKKTVDGVQVVRIWSYISTKTFWRRILNYGTFSFNAFFGGLISGKHDILLSFSPPLPLGVSAWLLSRLWGIPWILNVQDIYPEIAVVTGILKNPITINILEHLENFLYQKAAHIQVLSEGFKENLLNKGVHPNNISIIPVWADPDIIHPMAKYNSFSLENGLSDKFVIMYSGNLGINTSLEDVINAAILLKDEPGICFIFVGEGVKKKDLMIQAKEKDLKNVTFLPFQPRSIFNLMLASADLSVVTLNANAYYTSSPSKTFNIMASGRPILAVTPLGSELAGMVQEFECGIVVPPGKPEQLAREILLVQKNPKSISEMGHNGRKYLEERYTRKKCVELYDQDFQRLMNS